jgi:trans-2,3-dihydro-3-hydroxyanthranilate isomerase
MQLDYHLVDVFTTVPLAGNALAVVTDATGVDTPTMQRIAREFNLSETTFVLPTESRQNAPRVRIFTAHRELDFAGHPTIGTAAVARRLGLVAPSVTRFALAENVGHVPVRVDAGEDPLLWLTMPPIRMLAEVPRAAFAAALGLDERDLRPGVPCEIWSAGLPALFACVADVATVDRAALDARAFASLVDDRDDSPCAFVFTPTAAGAYARMFAPEFGIVEDPATGSVTGPLAAFMMAHELVSAADGTRFVSEQGTKMGRRSLLHVLVHGDRGRDGIEIGGHVAHVATGRLELLTH